MKWSLLFTSKINSCEGNVPKRVNVWRQQTIIIRHLIWPIRRVIYHSINDRETSCMSRLHFGACRELSRKKTVKFDCRYMSYRRARLRKDVFQRARNSQVKHGTRLYAVYNKESSRQRWVRQGAEVFKSAKQDKQFISKRKTEKSGYTSLRAATFETERGTERENSGKHEVYINFIKG